MLPILFDFAIVGGGIVGAATAYKLSVMYPNARIVLLEKEKHLATHQTGRNSGVIHSGIYYAPDSYKARLCVDGRQQLVAFAKENNVPHDVCGKIILATTEDEVVRLKGIFERGKANGLNGLKWLSPPEFQEIEPYTRGLQAVFVPQTGIIDFKVAVEKMKQRVLESPLNVVLTGFHVIAIYRQGGVGSLAFIGGRKTHCGVLRTYPNAGHQVGREANKPTVGVALGGAGFTCHGGGYAVISAVRIVIAQAHPGTC